MATSKFLNQSSNPYSAGAIVLDTTPITQYYLNQEAKKQAKDEALEKYYQDEMSKLSSEGMRSEDLPVFSQKFNKLKEMWVQNKEAIKNPSKYGFDKAQEYNQLRNDLLNIPIESKAEKEKDIFVTKLLGDPTKRELIDIPTLNEAMRLQKMPIRSEGRKSIDTANLPFVAKEMTPQEKQNYIKSTLSLIGTEGRFGEQKAIDKYKKGTEYIEEYSNKSLKLAGDKARTDALNNPTLRRTAKLDFERVSPEMKMELNKFHEEVYGRPIQSSEDILAAEIIQAGKMAKKVSVKTMEDYGAKAALRLSNSLASIAANQAKGGMQGVQGNLFDNIGVDVPLDFGGDKTLKNGIAVNKDGSPYNGEVFIPKDYIPSGIYSALKASGVDNDVLLSNNGFKARIKDGRIIGLNAPLLGYIDRQSMENAQLKFNTEPQKGVQPTFGQTNAPKPTTTKQKEIKRSDIAAKAAAAGYSVKEYEKLLKQNNVIIK